DSAADRAIELGEPARQALGQRGWRFESNQRNHAPATLQIVLGGKDARHLGAFLHQRVPLGAVWALALPPVLNGPAGLADITRFGLCHGGTIHEHASVERASSAAMQTSAKSPDMRR